MPFRNHWVLLGMKICLTISSKLSELLAECTDTLLLHCSHNAHHYLDDGDDGGGDDDDDDESSN